MRRERRRKPESVRFWEKVRKGGQDDCWEWTAGTFRGGYGMFTRTKEYGATRPAPAISAHRWAFLECVGPIPEGMLVDHICHNPRCVNPGHLRLATRKQNSENHAGRARRDSSTGVRGVSKHGPGYRARVRHHGKEHRTTVFPTIEQAEKAAIEMRNRLFTHNDKDKNAGHL